MTYPAQSGGLGRGRPITDPRGIPGFFGWWDIWSLRGGANMPVLRWPDEGNAHRDLLFTGTARPYLRWSPVDGLPEVFFPFDNPQLDYVAEGTIAGAMMAAVVVRSGWVATHDGQTVCDGVAGGSTVGLYGAGEEWRLNKEPPDFPDGQIASVGTRAGLGVVPQYQVITAILNNTQSILRVMGVEVSGAIAAGTPTMTDGLRLGNQRTGGSTNGFGDGMREFMLFVNPIASPYTVAQAKSLELSLIAKHRLAHRYTFS